MADDMSEGPGPNRATVALVDAKVGVVDAKVDGLASLIRAENASTREMLTPLAGLPVKVARLEEQVGDLERRLGLLEAASKARPAQILAVIALLSSVVSTLHWLGAF